MKDLTISESNEIAGGWDWGDFCAGFAFGASVATTLARGTAESIIIAAGTVGGILEEYYFWD